MTLVLGRCWSSIANAEVGGTVLSDEFAHFVNDLVPINNVPEIQQRSATIV
jgi:hypothetical protein